MPITESCQKNYVISILDGEGSVTKKSTIIELTITGRLADGTVFEATDIVKVIDKGGEKSTD